MEEGKNAYKGCEQCKVSGDLDFDFSMAMQPIFDMEMSSVFAYEALVRGKNNEPAYTVLSKVNDHNRYHFDQQCRVKAIQLAAQLGVKEKLSINFLPNAVYKPERCIRTTMHAANQAGFPLEKIMFEFSEMERIDDASHIKGIVDYYRSSGMLTAIDDFGSGHSGLNLLAKLATDFVKLDMALIRNIDKDAKRQSIVSHTLALLRELGIGVIAEGVESQFEHDWLSKHNVRYVQGYYYARPGFESLPELAV
ncbi:EAL domain-containing protein [Aestuariibacter sp. AA17]|uniref:EAL domain-containing protein n=1 Tax=Fluctibacter corallii TaxID=2984329 RepID=A0ABT3A4P7_9ALTE|nr:EAL domain-containing protein [Aestuariibacter sp. AA17]MCV2883668.1 EAL domain-containing protein [Aestuariibacter sp. AA17]